jgi:hypothetical protein
MIKMYRHRLVLLYATRMQVPKLKEPNALNFFGARRTTSVVPHYEYITIPYTYNIEDSLNKWVQKNLKGRYFLSKSVGVSNQSGRVETLIKVGFEDSKEMSYFMLACPLLKYK